MRLTGEKPAGDQQPRFVMADVIVSVRNESGRATQVSLGAKGETRRLGSVPSHAARSFSLPSDLERVGGLTFQASGRSGMIRSQPFEFEPGQRIVWTFDDRGSRSVISR